LMTTTAGASAQHLSFVRPLAGLPGQTEYTLAPFDDSGALFTLTGSTPGGPQFFVAAPRVFFKSYAPTLSAEATADLGLVATGAAAAEDPPVAGVAPFAYSPATDVPAADSPVLAASAPVEFQVLVVLTLGANLAEHTANLSAPIVV